MPSALRIVSAVATLVLLVGCAPTARANASPSGVGLRCDLEDAAALVAQMPEQADPVARAILRIRVAADESNEPLATILSAAERRARVILAIGASRALTSMEPRDLDAWLTRLSGIAGIARDRVAAFELEDAATSLGSPSADAFALKKAILALRGAAPDIPIAFTAGSAAGADGDLPGLASAVLPDEERDALWPFLDALSVLGGDPTALARDLAANRPAALPLWRHDLVEAEGVDVWTRLLAARAVGATLATITADASSAGRPRASAVDLRAALDALARAIPPDAEPVEAGPDAVAWPEGASVPHVLFLVPSDLSQRLVFGPAAASLRARGAHVVARLRERVAAPRLVDPSGIHEGAVEWGAEAGGISALRLPLVDRPLVLAFDRAGGEGELTSDVAVDAARDPSLEEILARHAARRAVRQGRVKSWSADLVTTMRYQIGGLGRSLDVRIESRYHERADGLKEIENLRFFLDGAPYEPRKGQPPELPLIQPEKVSVVPLDIHLDKSYEYELRGKATHEGRPAWRVAFKPSSGVADAWSGLALIDAATFDLLATDMTQAGLEAPILSNAQQEIHGPVATGDPASEAWLVRQVDVQRVMSLIGSNVLVNMRLTFSNVSVNDPEFETELASAHASDRQMLRDTATGLKYLRKDGSGERVPVEASTRKVFFIAGARFDDSLEHGVLPLAGVNILEADAWGKGLQVNAFLAGALNTLSISDPSLGGGRLSLAFDAVLPLIGQVDRVRGSASLDEASAARVREPRVSLSLGAPLGSHVQGSVEIRASRQSWSSTDDTLPTFHVPESTWVGSVLASLDLHGKGIDARVSVERTHRADWEAWGPEDALGEPTIETSSSSWKWRVQVGREFRVRPLQAFDVEAEYLGGDDLDRFNQHEFASFGGPELPGFGGSGIHFDEAGILRTRWSFSALGRVGFDVALGAARTRNEQLSAAEIAAIGFESTHVGLGVGATFPGPWRTVVRVEVGAAVSSPDHDGLAGDMTGQFLFTKFLK